MEAIRLISVQAELLLLMLLGVFIRKIGILSKSSISELTNLCIYIIFPFNIFKSFLIEMNWDILKQSAMLLAAAVLMQVFYFIVNHIAYNRYPREDKGVLQYCSFVPNGGFVGNAVAEGLYGSVGLLYASIFLIPQRALIWSVGTSYFTGGSASRKGFFKAILTHPCLVSVYLGLAAMITQIPLPSVLTETIGFVSSCNTAIIMIVIGAMLADYSTHGIFSHEVLYYCCLRLIVFPVCAIFIGMLCGLSGIVMQINVLMAAMPAGATSVVLAQKYDHNPELAAKCVLLSTVLSMITMPLWIMLVTTLIAI